MNPQEKNDGLAAFLVVMSLVLAGVFVYNTWNPTSTGGDLDVAGISQAAEAGTVVPTTQATTTTTATPTTTTTTEPPYEGWVDPKSSGQAWSELGAVEGLLTFRGNPTRSFYGQGPVPVNPVVLWQSEIGCSNSTVGGQAKYWCGSGWTGQPSVFHPPGDPEAWWVAFGGYNRKINFKDPETGAEVYPPYATGDIVKGSITIDPDGFPLLYTGSRDDNFHVVALDGPEPNVLWKLPWDAVKPTKWNNDWDGSALVIGDYLIEGGENSRWFVVKLNRAYDAAGMVTVDPKIVFSAPGWDAELLSALGGSNGVSIENSVAISGNTVYFGNGGGLIQGWDISSIEEGIDPTRVFRYWAGDDIDATIVIDDEGMLYAGIEYERGNSRSKEVGQIIKLDPSKPDDPLVWGRDARSGLDSGIWATPALWQDLLIVPTDDGQMLGLDRATGDERWAFNLPGPLWQSPVVVDDVLIQGDCLGHLHAFDLTGQGTPTELWDVYLGEGCIESTPAVWGGRIFVGSRNGNFYAIGDQ